MGWIQILQICCKFNRKEYLIWGEQMVLFHFLIHSDRVLDNCCSGDFNFWTCRRRSTVNHSFHPSTSCMLQVNEKSQMERVWFHLVLRLKIGNNGNTSISCISNPLSTCSPRSAPELSRRRKQTAISLPPTCVWSQWHTKTTIVGAGSSSGPWFVEKQRSTAPVPTAVLQWKNQIEPMSLKVVETPEPCVYSEMDPNIRQK